MAGVVKTNSQAAVEGAGSSELSIASACPEPARIMDCATLGTN